MKRFASGLFIVSLLLSAAGFIVWLPLEDSRGLEMLKVSCAIWWVGFGLLSLLDRRRKTA